MESKIVVNVFDIAAGLEVFESVDSIVINSKTYNLLIMKDYMPLIGEVDGTIVIKSKDEEIKRYENIGASYILKSNEFNLIIRKRL